MNHRLSLRILLVLVCLAIFWTSPTWARLWPPCQAINWTMDTTTSVRYGYTDPTSGVYMEETWVHSQGNERTILSVQVDQGILTWISRHVNAGESYYTFQVHFRIYDPGRGMWKAGSWGPFIGYTTWLDQHQVKDGVIAWEAHRTLGAGPTDKKEHWVWYATYDPDFGSWALGNDYWPVDSPSKYGPEVLRVKNGVVAWPMRDAKYGNASDQTVIDIFFAIYDQEVHQWKDAYATVHGGLGEGFDWIEIVEDSVYVKVRFTNAPYYSQDKWYMYDPYGHEWVWQSSFYPDLDRRPFFVAQPTSGIVPFRVWFWDCSTALDGVPNPSVWDWIFAPDWTGADRSPSFLYTGPGVFTVNESVNYAGGFYIYNAEGQITAQPPAPPSGGISINNGATYATSANVTLSLNYGSTTTQMCFRQSPGWALWGSWQPVAASRDWTLSTVLGTSDGPHYVWVKFKDQYGTESPEYQASIILDITPPAAILTLNDGAATTINPTVKVSMSASDAIGIERMSYTSFNEGDSKYMWTHVDLPSLLTYRPKPSSIKFSSKPGRKTVMVRFTDVAGNITHTQASIKLKPAPLTFLPLLLD
jgi:hypothetical protein